MNITKPIKVLGVGLMCMTATFTNVSAQQEDSSINKTMGGGVDITTDSETNVPISRDIPSSFSVRIPQSINFTSGNDVAGFTIEVKGNIRADEELKVTVPASIAITAENDASYANTATVEMDFHAFYRAGLNLDTYTAVNGSVSFNETKADTYKGSVNFKVALERTIKLVRTIDVGEVADTVTASLYDNGDLVVSGNGTIKGTGLTGSNFVNETSKGETTRATKKIIVEEDVKFPTESQRLFA